MGGEDAERASSMASPRVTGIQLSDVLENSDPEKIESLADEFCGQKGKRVKRFRRGSKSMGGRYETVYRFDCVAC